MPDLTREKTLNNETAEINESQRTGEWTAAIAMEYTWSYNEGTTKHISVRLATGHTLGTFLKGDNEENRLGRLRNSNPFHPPEQAAMQKDGRSLWQTKVRQTAG